MLQGNTDKNKVTGFDFTGNMALLVDDIIKTHPFFKHIRIENILVAISPSNGNRNGVVAKLRPMLFEGGSQTKVVRGIEYAAPQVIMNGINILYIVYFHLPRFLNHGNEKTKLSTVIHELHHVSPLFNGDIRRYSGKNYAHGNSRKDFDDLISIYTDEYISDTIHPELSNFLKYKYNELKRKYGAIYGNMIRIPRLRNISFKKTMANI
jgi:predicted metallopeptidase